MNLQFEIKKSETSTKKRKRKRNNMKTKWSKMGHRLILKAQVVIPQYVFDIGPFKTMCFTTVELPGHCVL